MVQTFAKSQPARQLEARARARRLGVRVAVVVPQRHYVTHSQSDAGVTYRLDRTRQGWTCECRGFQYTGCCKHLAGLQRRAEREGWDFHTIAPLSAVPGTAAHEERQARTARGRADLFG
jgi:hypothetical protein